MWLRTWCLVRAQYGRSVSCLLLEVWRWWAMGQGSCWPHRRVSPRRVLLVWTGPKFPSPRCLTWVDRAEGSWLIWSSSQKPMNQIRSQFTTSHRNTLCRLLAHFPCRKLLKCRVSLAPDRELGPQSEDWMTFGSEPCPGHFIKRNVCPVDPTLGPAWQDVISLTVLHGPHHGLPWWHPFPLTPWWPVNTSLLWIC